MQPSESIETVNVSTGSFDAEHSCSFGHLHRNFRLWHFTHLERECHVFEDRHVWIERIVLKDHRYIAVLWFERDHAFAIDPDVAAVELLEAGEHPERRRLAAAARAEQDEELAVGDVEGQALHRGRIARRELLPDVVVLDA